MAITKTEILDKVNAITRRAETDIDDEIQAILRDISVRENFLFKESLLSTTSGDNVYSLPADYKAKLALTCEDSEEEVLIKIPFHVYLKNKESEGSGTPEYFAIHNKFFWLLPIPDDVFTLTLHYAILHPMDADDILYDEEFRECIVQGTAWKVYERYEIFDRGEAKRIRYEAEINKLRNLAESQVGITSYTDI
jgi:hypothetical protein